MKTMLLVATAQSAAFLCQAAQRDPVLVHMPAKHLGTKTMAAPSKALRQCTQARTGMMQQQGSMHPKMAAAQPWELQLLHMCQRTRKLALMVQRLILILISRRTDTWWLGMQRGQRGAHSSWLKLQLRSWAEERASA